MKRKKRIISFVLSFLMMVSSSTVMIANAENYQYLLGDINIDGLITITDVVMARSAIVGNLELSGDQLIIADIDKDGNVGITDVVQIRLHIVGTKIITDYAEFVDKPAVTEPDNPSEGNTDPATPGTSGDSEVVADTVITLNGSFVEIDGTGATANGSIITVTEGKTYSISGTLNDGQIIVNSEEDVELILNGADITCLNSSAIYGISGDMSIKAQGGTVNTLTDGSVYTIQNEEAEPDACVFSKDRITFKGSGTLTVNGNYMYGVSSKDELKIKNSMLVVNSVDDAIRGKDFVEITGGTIKVISDGGDGIKSTQGYIYTDSSENQTNIYVTADNDALQAETKIDILNASVQASGKRGITAVENTTFTDSYVFVTSREAFGDSTINSNQPSIYLNYAIADNEKGQQIIVAKDEQAVIEYSPTKKFTYVMITSSKLLSNTAYAVTTGGYQMTYDTAEIQGEFNIVSEKNIFNNVTSTGTALDIMGETTYIAFENSNADITGNGASFSNGVLTIMQAGIYNISGTLENGQIVVNSEADVDIILNGVSVTNNSGAAFYGINGDTTFELAAGTENVFTDGSNYMNVDENNEPDGCMFSSDRITIKGTGKLKVIAKYLDGIVGKDEINIKNGIVDVTSADDGIRGKDYVNITGGTIIVNAGGDGIKSTNTEADTGYVIVEDGNITIDAGNDGIDAESYVAINGGAFNIKSGLSGSGSGKGIKGATALNIAGGSIDITAKDDGLHTNAAMMLTGGDMIISSDDDGVHADVSLTIDKTANINITKSYEGLESALITINNGTVHVVSSDDGFNASDGTGGGMGGFPGQAGTAGNSSSCALVINSGYVYVNAGGDGLDSNGNFTINGGTVLVNGPTGNGDGILDSGDSSEIIINGGTLIGAGSSGMLEKPSNSSLQYTLTYSGNTIAANTMIAVCDSTGKPLMVFKPAKQIQAVIFSSSEIKSGSVYYLYSGGSYDGGTSQDGYYSGGTYTLGTQLASFTVSQKVTSVGSGGGTRPSGR